QSYCDERASKPPSPAGRRLLELFAVAIPKQLFTSALVGYTRVIPRRNEQHGGSINEARCTPSWSLAPCSCCFHLHRSRPGSVQPGPRHASNTHQHLPRPLRRVLCRLEEKRCSSVGSGEKGWPDRRLQPLSQSSAVGIK